MCAVHGGAGPPSKGRATQGDKMRLRADAMHPVHVQTGGREVCNDCRGMGTRCTPGGSDSRAWSTNGNVECLPRAAPQGPWDRGGSKRGGGGGVEGEGGAGGAMAKV